MARPYKNIRIFKSDLLEACTHVHPLIPLLLWLPFSFWMMKMGILDQGLSAVEILLVSIGALLFWTFAEYSVHRFLFHFPAKSDFGKWLIFLFHGLHHDEPNDPTRLVMPPVPAILLVGLFFVLFQLVLPPQYVHLFLGVFLIGYLCYDYIHYATHHFPMTSKIGKFLKKYHITHHNRHDGTKFGVSTPLWDYIFGTYHPK